MIQNRAIQEETHRRRHRIRWHVKVAAWGLRHCESCCGFSRFLLFAAAPRIDCLSLAALLLLRRRFLLLWRHFLWRCFCPSWGICRDKEHQDRDNTTGSMSNASPKIVKAQKDSEQFRRKRNTHQSSQSYRHDVIGRQLQFNSPREEASWLFAFACTCETLQNREK